MASAVRALVTAALAGALFALLAWAMLGLPPPTGGLAPRVAERLRESGVEHAVTAVLLNFRAWDTLLEVAVLALALLGAVYVRAGMAADAAPADAESAGGVLAAFGRAAPPVMAVVAFYLLWQGSHAPGGAFQAAAVLAGAGLIRVLAGHAAAPAFASRRRRAAVMGGYALFLGVAAGTLAASGAMLRYPPRLAGAIIFGVELALAVSLGLLLVAFFAAGRGGGRR